MNQFCIHILPLLPKLLPVALALQIVGVMAGYATTDTEPDANDPLERANRAVYGFNDILDDYVLDPIADNYLKYVPHPIQPRPCFGYTCVYALIPRRSEHEDAAFTFE